LEHLLAAGEGCSAKSAPRKYTKQKQTKNVLNGIGSDVAQSPGLLPDDCAQDSERGAFTMFQVAICQLFTLHKKGYSFTMAAKKGVVE